MSRTLRRTTTTTKTKPRKSAARRKPAARRAPAKPPPTRRKQPVPPRARRRERVPAAEPRPPPGAVPVPGPAKPPQSMTLQEALMYIWQRSHTATYGEESLAFLEKRHSNVACLFTKSGELVYLPPGQTPELDPRRLTQAVVEFHCNSTPSTCVLSVPRGTRYALEACRRGGKRFYFGLLLWVVKPAREETRTGHANALVIDTQKNTIERFEPHGAVFRGPTEFSEDVLNEKMNRWATEIGYRYIPPSEFCPALGPQVVQEMEAAAKIKEPERIGFCQTWSLWYLDQRLSFPDIPPDILQANLIALFQRDSRPLTDFIRSYVVFLFQSVYGE